MHRSRGPAWVRRPWLEVICSGAMFAGKSTELLRQLRRAQFGGARVLLVRPALDDRGFLTHDGVGEDPGVPVQVARELGGLGVAVLGQDVVGIDEGHFFKPGDLALAVEALLEARTTVLIAGLTTTAEGEPFPSMSWALDHSDHVTSLSAVCVGCGGVATRTGRIGEAQDGSGISVGAGDQYKPFCRSCWSG